MTTLVVGASGATGRLLVQQLLQRGEHVRAIVRSPEKMSELLGEHEGLSLIAASVLDLSEAEMIQHVSGCRAVASCLGHNLTLSGMFGAPRRLVTDATSRLCAAVKTSGTRTPVRFVLMNTAGNSNRDLLEPISFAQNCVIHLLRWLLPPHADNECAADYLRLNMGPQQAQIEWVAVRPDGLVDEDQVTEYQLHASPERSAIFNSGRTSRINVGHFMADLILDDELWNNWQGKMPVIYNAE